MYSRSLPFLHFGNDRVFSFAQHGVCSGLGQVVELAVLLGLDVIDLRADRQEFVGRQGPGRGGPGQEVGVFFGLGLEGDRQGDDRHFFVALGDFVRSQARSAARAVREYFVTLIDQPRLEELGQDPPDGFDVVVIQRNVGVIHVDEVAHAMRHVAPHGFVREHGFLALFVEFFNAVFLDVLLAGESQLLFHFDLHGQAVGVPAGFPADPVALHGLIAQHGVLQRAGGHMMDARLAVGRGRPFVENKIGLAFSGAHALFQQIFFVPFVRLGKLHLRNRCVGQVFVHGLPSIKMNCKIRTR